jgi:protein-tyrosine phosphatase
VPPADALSLPIPSPVELPLEVGRSLRVPSPRTVRRIGLRVLAGFVAFLALGNLAIFVAMLAAQATAPTVAPVPAAVSQTISNAEVVDDHLWRGGAPSEAGYRALADAGVTTVVDLRAEDDLAVPTELLDELGITRVAMPLRDGQAPTPGFVDAFLRNVQGSDGRVFVHCGAGVGRTGAVVAAYRVQEHGSSGLGAMRANLEVGPPSLEQLAFAAGMSQGESADRPNPAIVAASRLLDAPRRIWKNLEG